MGKYVLLILVTMVSSYLSVFCMEPEDSVGLPRYVYGRNESGIHIIDIRKQFEKIQLAVRVMVQRDLDNILMKHSEKINDDFRKQRQNAEIKRVIRQRIAHYK